MPQQLQVCATENKECECSDAGDMLFVCLTLRHHSKSVRESNNERGEGDDGHPVHRDPGAKLSDRHAISALEELGAP